MYNDNYSAKIGSLPSESEEFGSPHYTIKVSIKPQEPIYLKYNTMQFAITINNKTKLCNIK